MSPDGRFRDTITGKLDLDGRAFRIRDGRRISGEVPMERLFGLGEIVAMERAGNKLFVRLPDRFYTVIFQGMPGQQRRLIEVFAQVVGLPVTDAPKKTPPVVKVIAGGVVAVGLVAALVAGSGEGASPKGPKVEPTASSQDSRPNVNYTIIDEQVSDTPAKTQVRLQVLVPPKTTKSELDAVMRYLYEEVAARSGFEHHEHPTAIYIDIGADKKAMEDDPAHAVLGRVWKSHVDAGPSFFNDLLDAELLEQARKALLPAKVFGDGYDADIKQDGPGKLTLTQHIVDIKDGGRSYPAKLYAAERWMTTFITFELAFNKVPSIGELRTVWVYKGKPVVDLTISRGLWKGLDWPAARDQYLADVNFVEEQYVAGKLTDGAYERGLLKVAAVRLWPLVQAVAEEKRKVSEEMTLEE